MPSIYDTILEKEQSITRPAIIAIVNQVKQLTNLSQDIPIRFTGDTKKQSSNSSTIDDGQSRLAKFTTGRYIFIEVVEDYDKESLGTTSMGFNEHNPVFLDKKLNTVINPIYATSNVSIDFKFRTNSKNEAIAWRDNVRFQVSRMRDLSLHSIDYHYSIPDNFVLVLQEIHRLRESLEPYGETFHQYVQANSVNRTRLISDITGKHYEYVISETQIRIIGRFDFDGIPEKMERDEENGTHELTFSYIFNYQKPIACSMRYPISVHNQLLNPMFTTFSITNKTPDKASARFSNSLAALYEFEGNKTMGDVIHFEGPIRIPEYDDFVIPHKQVGVATIFTALIEVDVVDKMTLLNLNNLGNLQLDQELIKWFKSGEYPYICDIYKSIINFSLYRNDYLVRDNTLTCDSELNIKSTVALDIRNQYRVKMSIVIDLSILKRDVVYRIFRNRAIIKLLLPELNNYIRNSTDLEPLKNDLVGSMPEYYLSYIYNLLKIGAYHLDASHSIEYLARINNTNQDFRYLGDLSGMDYSIMDELRHSRKTLATVSITGIAAISK